jgi:hypothetical protein
MPSGAICQFGKADTDPVGLRVKSIGMLRKALVERLQPT